MKKKSMNVRFYGSTDGYTKKSPEKNFKKLDILKIMIIILVY